MGEKLVQKNRKVSSSSHCNNEYFLLFMLIFQDVFERFLIVLYPKKYRFIEKMDTTECSIKLTLTAKSNEDFF